MGLLAFFRSSSASDTDDRPRSLGSARPPARGGDVRRWAPAISKKAREHERQGAIAALARIGTVSAAAVLLRRFDFDTEISITDREEKETAFKAIVAIGEEALPAIRAHCERAESLTWVVRILRAVLDDDAYVEELDGLLGAWDTEYARNAEPKVHLIAGCELVDDPRVPAIVERFLEDVHEPTRFQTVGALLAQRDPAAAGPLARALSREEAARIVARIADGLAARAWPIPVEERAAVARRLPYRFRLDELGVLRALAR
jgi:hypothetical protein